LLNKLKLFLYYRVMTKRLIILTIGLVYLPFFASAADFKQLVLKSPNVKLAESRVYKNVTVFQALEGLKKALEMHGQVIETYEPELGILTSSRNKRSGPAATGPEKLVNSLISSRQLGIFGKKTPDPILEARATFIVTTTGENDENVLVQGRLLYLNWGSEETVTASAVLNEELEYEMIYYILENELDRLQEVQ